MSQTNAVSPNGVTHLCLLVIRPKGPSFERLVQGPRECHSVAGGPVTHVVDCEPLRLKRERGRGGGACRTQRQLMMDDGAVGRWRRMAPRNASWIAVGRLGLPVGCLRLGSLPAGTRRASGAPPTARRMARLITPPPRPTPGKHGGTGQAARGQGEMDDDERARERARRGLAQRRAPEADGSKAGAVAI